MRYSSVVVGLYANVQLAVHETKDAAESQTGWRMLIAEVLCIVSHWYVRRMPSCFRCLCPAEPKATWLIARAAWLS